MNTAGLDRALKTLGPYLGDLVLCGAWAWYLYRRCLATPRWIPSEFTRDLDCVGRERLPVRETPLLQRLEAHDFEWVPRGSEGPPAAHFAWPNRDKPAIEIEFLVPARGAGTLRVVTLQEGLTAVALRHLDVLLDAPLTISIDDNSPLADELEFRGEVRVPKMGHFVIQKALIHGLREREDQVKDLAYVFDLIDGQNGLRSRVSQDVAAARTAWTAGVSKLAEVLRQRAGEPAFLKAMTEQLPEEQRAPMTYLAREIQTWLEQLGV